MTLIGFAGPWAAIFDDFLYFLLISGQKGGPAGLEIEIYSWKMIKMVPGSFV